jgi:enoyl-CoA hydratase/carnithine racemase
MDPSIVTQVAERVLRIEIRRPERRNALTVAMYAAMADALGAASADPAVRAVLLHGQPGVFTSGNDIADFVSGATDFAEDQPVFRFLHALSTSQKPIVAAVTGPAIGIGTTLLLHCDLVYAGASARFQLPFVNLAHVPEAASTLLLPAAIGHPRAAELLLLGEPFAAAKAREYGVITDVVTDAEVMDVARNAALALAAKPPAALRLTRTLMKQALAGAVAARMREEARHFAAQRGSPEATEAFQAFFDKREPDFSRFE